MRDVSAASKSATFTGEACGEKMAQRLTLDLILGNKRGRPRSNPNPLSLTRMETVWQVACTFLRHEDHLFVDAMMNYIAVLRMIQLDGLSNIPRLKFVRTTDLSQVTIEI